MVKFTTQFSPRKRVTLTFTEPSMTKQAPANEVDINQIMDRYLKTGELPSPRPAQYGDATEIPDFETAMQIVIAGQNAFEALPAKLRERFGNDPAQFLAFIDDPANYDEAVKLGLVQAKETPVSVEKPEEPAATQTGESKAEA